MSRTMVEIFNGVVRSRIESPMDQFGKSEIYVSAESAVEGANPVWAGAGKVHDWRNHVPEKVRAIWGTFTREQRQAIVAWAEMLADREEWE